MSHEKPRGPFSRLALPAALILVSASALVEPRLARADDAGAPPPARALPTKATRASLDAQIEAEEHTVLRLTSEVTELEGRMKVVVAREAKFESLGPILSSVGQGMRGKGELDALLAAEIAAVGIPLTRDQLSALVDGLTKGGRGGMALATFVCNAIAESSTDSSRKTASSDAIIRAAQLAARGAQLDPVAIGDIFAKSASASSVTIPLDQLEPAAKLSGAPAATYIVGVVRKLNQAVGTHASQRVDAAKTEITAAQRKTVVLKQQRERVR